MSNGKLQTSAIAIGKTGEWYRAVEVNRVADRFEITRFFSREVEGLSIAQFCAELDSAGWRKQLPDGLTPLIVTFEGQTVVYRRIEVPARGERELEAIVRMQAESLLPLGPDELEIGWREGRSRSGRVGVTLAATRGSGIKGFADDVAGMGPARITLEIDGFVRAWSEACSFEGERAVVVRLKNDSTDVCLVEDGLLSQATRIDTGINDLLSEQTLAMAEAERLKQDIEGACEMFGVGDGVSIHLVSDGSADIAAVVKYLARSGLNVKPSTPRGWSAANGAAIPAAELYPYMAQAGAAMLMLEGRKELNVFGRLYRPQEAGDEAPKGLPLKTAGLIAAAAVLLTALAWYGLDKMEARRLQTLLHQTQDGTNALAMLAEHKAVNETAGERPDMLEILSLLKESAPADVTFHSFTFRKGRPIRVTGQARSNDSLYKFEAEMRGKNGVSNVKEQSAVKDERENRVVFTVTFDYGNFTKSQSEPLAVFGR